MDRRIHLKLKNFLLLEANPAEWKGMDLYAVADGGTVFYVGQSSLVYNRLWDHILDGFKARSELGRFLLCNWPKSLNFEILILCSRNSEFAGVGHDLSRAEEKLIAQYRPCFNAVLNADPNPLPPGYAPPGSAIRCSRSPTKLKFQAALAVKNDEKKKWVEP